MRRPFLIIVLSVCLTAFSVSLAAQNRAGGAALPSSSSGESSGASSKKKEVALRIKAWTVDDMLGQKTETVLDTLMDDYYLITTPERHVVGGNHLGHVGSPFQTMVYADRNPEERFLFMNPYDQWKSSNGEWVWLNTTRPYTNGSYNTTVGNDYSQEENFKFSYTANVNKYLNIGADYEAVNSRGFYTNLKAKDKIAHVFGNYQSPRYEAFVRLSYHRFENYENGGITNDAYITDPMTMSHGYREFESLNIPVALQNTFNLHTYKDAFLNQKYHLGFYRELTSETDTSEVFVPVSSLIHTFQIDHGRKLYDSPKSANSSYYPNAFIDESMTADSAALTTIRNVLGLSLNEGFHPWMKFGLTAYAQHEHRRYAYPTRTPQPDSIAGSPFRQADIRRENLLWVGGRLVSTQDSLIRFDADARICLAGNGYIGNFVIDGGLQSRFSLLGQEVDLSARGFVRNETPDYFYRQYHSNHFNWSNSFDNVYRVRLEGGLEMPGWGTRLNAGVENVSNYVYFGPAAKPVQYSGQLQVLYGEWAQKLSVGILHLDFDVVGQLSSQEDVLPLPALTAFGNVYVKTVLSKVMTTQIGVDCRYFTSYHAPAYDPATGMFHTQSEKELGNYPFMNVYANLHLKRARFFAMYEHVSRWLASPNYFTTLHYPQPPASFKAGISWNFYD